MFPPIFIIFFIGTPPNNFYSMTYYFNSLNNFRPFFEKSIVELYN